MTLFSKLFLSLAATHLIFALASVAPRAGGAMPPDARIDRLEVQLAETPDEILIAQGYGRPPGDIGEGAESPFPSGPPDGGQGDSASLLIRLGRLESQMRQINGQIEQLQFEIRRLGEQLKKFQDDVDFRFRDGVQRAPSGTAPQRRGDAQEPQLNGKDRAAPQTQNAGAAAPRLNRRGDAFDPSLELAAPGAPRPLGSPPAEGAGSVGGQLGAGQTDPGAPLDLSNGRSWTSGTPPAPPIAPAGVPASDAPEVTLFTAQPSTPKGEFDIALAYLKHRAYENAERGFAGFLEKNPRDKLVSDAIYYLGESYYLRGRRREAAEQYLKVSTQYASSPRAPQALLRLGQSLSALGAKEQACATFSEVARKYPDAPAMVKTGADREAKRTQC
ncbi:MAG: tol-pal system protein YbgF [Beijerinckiaceae bacterium]|nr:tol-pal system protein YbgF [Beijerinckiaceae bacterium]MCI0735517.1 tol-pal system protein YbgF [Beijerinckiaceae bacterium]